MSFQWLRMRITEEQDRRTREALIADRLPLAVEAVQEAIAACVKTYTDAFGADSAEIQTAPALIRIVVRDQADGEWIDRAKIEIYVEDKIPGFRIERGGDRPPLEIEVGLLPGDKLFYRDRAEDQYVSMDEVTHRSLDRALFPKLRE